MRATGSTRARFAHLFLAPFHAQLVISCCCCRANVRQGERQRGICQSERRTRPGMMAKNMMNLASSVSAFRVSVNTTCRSSARMQLSHGQIAVQ